MNAAEEFAAKVKQGCERYVMELSRSPQSYPSNRASEIGHPCTRYLVLNRTEGDKASAPSPELQMLFNEGNLHERDMLRWLSDYADIHVTGSQTSFPPNNYNITGHVDGLLAADLVVEIKSLNGTHYKQINTAFDLRNTLVWFIKKWYVQLQIYMFLSDRELAVVAIKNKWTGERKAIAVEIDYEYVEGLLERVEAVNRHVRNNTTPDYVSDRSVCKRCPYFGRACDPPMKSAPLDVVTDELVIRRVARVKELQEDGEEYVAQMGWVKDWAKSQAPHDDYQPPGGAVRVLEVGDHFVRIRKIMTVRGASCRITVD